MEIETASEAVLESRRITLDLICRHHRMDCDTCSRYTDCELHALLRELGMDYRVYERIYHEKSKDLTSPAVVRDSSKCVLCRRCEAACAEQGIYAIGALGRADGTKLGAVVPMPETGCIGCGRCLAVCPTGALSVVNENKAVRIALNRKKHVVFAVTKFSADNAPRYFGRCGVPAEKLAQILRACGADKVVDAAGFYHLSAGEAASALERGGRGVSPVCPAAARVSGKTVLGRHPEEIFNSWCKGEYAAGAGIRGEDVFTVWVSPCTALKKSHACDAAMTTRELYEFILRACVSRHTMRQVWKETPGEAFDQSVSLPDPCDSLGHIAEAVQRMAKERGMEARTACGEGCPAIHAAEDAGFADFLACPGGCPCGGGNAPARDA